ncbi:F390 synthetase-related protein [Brevibacillus fluminis]|uniref:F390 synthetase-related protein n=1 Tax=Brevibacillus fluminis TaxID=511487 RepID=UPI003F89FE49
MGVGSRFADLAAFIRYYANAKRGGRFRTRAALEAWQDRQVRAFLAFVRSRSPFYREYYSGLEERDWQRYPLIDKTIMMAEFDRLNTAGIGREEAFALALKAEETRDFTPEIRGITIGLSSGTSGNRGLFLVSPQERVMWAATMLGKALPGSLFAEQRIAFFLRANSNLYGSVQKGRIQFRFFDLLDDVSCHIERLNRYQPSIIVAPPSMLRLLGEAQMRGELAVAPAKIISVAEVLDPLDQSFLSACFKQVIHQVYQCTEGFLATTCSHGTLHLNEDLLVIQKEYLDREQGKFVPIITDFTRTTQPIIRYRLNDILTEQRVPCPCGSVFTPIASIEGRCDDLFYFPSVKNGELVPVFPDFIRRAVIAATPDVCEYRVIQEGPQHVQIMLRGPEAKRQEMEDAVAASLCHILEGMGVRPPVIGFIPYEFVPGATKLRRVERRCTLV